MNADALIQIIVAQLVGTFFGAVSAYVAIKSKLAELDVRMNNVEAATKRAHERVDALKDAA